jgi:hypothetical protein
LVSGFIHLLRYCYTIYHFSLIYRDFILLKKIYFYFVQIKKCLLLRHILITHTSFYCNSHTHLYIHKSINQLSHIIIEFHIFSFTFFQKSFSTYVLKTYINISFYISYVFFQFFIFLYPLT